LNQKVEQYVWDGVFMLGFATVAITGALVFYTIGVFAEHQSGTLKLSHIVLFYLGFTCDTTGTACMSFIAQNGSQNPVHATTGALAIILMIVHAVWATIVYSKKNPTTLARFHRLSIGVWLVWLVPYICGMLMGIPALAIGPNLALGIAIGIAFVIGLIAYQCKPCART
jgi:TIGR03987 family protein